MHDRSMTLILRDSTPADIPAIAAIYGDAVRTGLASFEYDPQAPLRSLTGAMA